MISISDSKEFESHLRDVADAIAQFRVIPFLGAGANMCASVDDTDLGSAGGSSPPGGNQLAAKLAERFRYPVLSCKNPGCTMTGARDLDLMHVAQYGEVRKGRGTLYDELRAIFNKKTFTPTRVHRFLAGLPAPPDSAEAPDRHLLIVTTNYDDLMEQALREARKPFDLVFYKPYGDGAYGEPRGRFWHRAPGEEPKIIENGNDHRYKFLTKRPVILKIHGTVYKPEVHDGFVITEDDYIEYLAEEALRARLPAVLLARLRKNHLLFLGYSLRDWNLRVFLWRLRRNPKDARQSWAVQLGADETDGKFWAKHSVELVDADLADYLRRL